MTVHEAYHPDRVLRQFGLVQTVPDPPIDPVEVTRLAELHRYIVAHSDEQLQRWDLDPRPLIDLDGPQATHFWDVSEDYHAFLDEASHVMVDPRSTRPERMVGSDYLAVIFFKFLISINCIYFYLIDFLTFKLFLQRSRHLVGEIRSLLAVPEASRPPMSTDLLRRWLETLTGEAPRPHQPHIFKESTYEPGESSGAHFDEPSDS